MSSLLQRMKDKYVGKKFTVNCGWTCEVLDYKNNREVLVRGRNLHTIARSISIPCTVVRTTTTRRTLRLGMLDLCTR